MSDEARSPRPEKADLSYLGNFTPPDDDGDDVRLFLSLLLLLHFFKAANTLVPIARS